MISSWSNEHCSLFDWTWKAGIQTWLFELFVCNMQMNQNCLERSLICRLWVCTSLVLRWRNDGVALRIRGVEQIFTFIRIYRNFFSQTDIFCAVLSLNWNRDEFDYLIRLVQLIYQDSCLHITTYLISLLYLYDHMKGNYNIYKTVCRLLWGRGAGSANDHGLKVVDVIYPILPEKFSAWNWS